MSWSYTDLQAKIATWLNRTDLSAVIPDFVLLAEAQFVRELRLRKQITSATLTTVAGTRGVSLPADWLEFENVSLLTSPERQLSYGTVEQLDAVYPNNSVTDKPTLYTIEGDQILFAPTPDSAYPVSVLYYAAFPALSTSGSNWLLVNHPAVYLYASLVQACMYLKDTQGAELYRGLYQDAASNVQRADDRAQHTGSVLRVRAL